MPPPHTGLIDARLTKVEDVARDTKLYTFARADGGKLPPYSPGAHIDLHLPNGLRALGYETADIPRLVEGTLPQHRVTKLSPRPAGPEDLARLFEESMLAW